MDTRRTFLKKAAAGTAALPFVNIPSAFAGSKIKFGIILNTVKDAMKSDYKSTLEKMADLGYKYIEGGVYGDSAKEYAKLLKSLGLKSVAGGSSMGNLQEELDSYIENANELNYDFITCYWPWLSSANDLTKDECLQTAERLNEVGKKIKEAGFKLTWHNHDKEFVDLDGTMPFDILMEHTDPKYVGVQMDLYWVRKGGQNPVDLIKKYPGRFDMYHVKDMVDTPDRGMTCVGSGIIDFKEIFELDKMAGVKYRIVENEQATEGIKCATTSYRHLASL